MSVFTTFPTREYKYFVLTHTSNGYKIVEEHKAEGIFKIISGHNDTDNLENVTSDAKLKIKPDEPFFDDETELMGNGVEILGETYRIEGVSRAEEFDTQRVDFYNLNLKKEILWDESPSPLT